MIAITFALRAESSGLTAQLRDGKIDNQKIEIVHTGVGRKACERKMEEFLNATRPDLLISAGFAGGVTEDLRAGDLILAENFSDRQLLSTAQQALVAQKVRTITLFTAESIIDSIADRNRIVKEHGAAAIDMETEFIASACAAHSIRMLSLRVISDTPLEPFPAPPAILFDIEKQNTNFFRLAAYLVTHPTAIPRLLRFSRQIGHAQKNLTDALVRLLETDLLGKPA
jgi:adenosylhomocysteine nucleosidase